MTTVQILNQGHDLHHLQFVETAAGENGYAERLCLWPLAANYCRPPHYLVDECRRTTARSSGGQTCARATVKGFGAALEPGGSGLLHADPSEDWSDWSAVVVPFFTGHFVARTYGLICFFTDHKTGAPHFTKGMVLDFDVK